jgi:hypothetical protein
MHIEPANYMCVPVKHENLDSVKIGALEGGLKVHTTHTVKYIFFKLLYVKINITHGHLLSHSH